MNRDGRVAQHRLGARRDDIDRERAVFCRVADAPQETVALLVFDFRVGDGRLRDRVPVDQPRPAIDQAVAVECDEYFRDDRGEALVHREAFARPVRSEAERTKLLVDDAAVLFAPAPRAFEVGLAAELFARRPFAFQFSDQDRLGRDRRVVLSRDPVRIVAQHSMVARQHVHGRVGRAVPDVGTARDVQGRHRDHERRSRRIGILVEHARVLPRRVTAGLDRCRVVATGQLRRLTVHASRV